MASEAEMRAALEWETGTRQPDNKNVFEWLWESIQGDFNEERSTGQIAFDAALSTLPLVDQICDVRDIVANCRAIAASDEKDDNTWKWVTLSLTLIGLIPGVGSIVKGVLKICFLFMRRYGLDKLMKATDDAMTWVITFLRKREVQKVLRELQVDETFKWLADQIRVVKGQVNASTLLQSFDKGIAIMKGLLGKVSELPVIGKRARATLEMVEKVRKTADARIRQALEPAQQILDAIIRRMEVENLIQRSGILDAKNVHFRGTLPEAQAVALMRKADPLPPWLSKGRNGAFTQLQPSPKIKSDITERIDRGWPGLTDDNIRSFHKLNADTIVGPAKLYRITSPTNGAMGDCWVTEEVFHRLMHAPDPKAAWRKHLAVWPDWNPNGQFVVFEVPKGESLKVWRGPASSQVKVDRPDLNANLEGGWEQVVFNPSKENKAQWDSTRIYQRNGNSGTLKETPISYAEYRTLPASRKHAYLPVRERIEDPRIKGPYDTGWGTTDFDPQLQDAKIGLPALPGQVSNSVK